MRNHLSRVGAVALSITAGASALAGGRDLVVVSDSSNNVLRFDSAGSPVGALFGGLGGYGFTTVGPDGHIYVTDSATACIHKVHGRTGAYLGVFVLPGAGGLTEPRGLTFGPDGDLYVTNAGATTPKIIAFNGATGAYRRTVVASGPAIPGSLMFGPDGIIYEVCTTCQAIHKHDPVTGAGLGVFIPNFPDGIKKPRALTFGPDGRVYATSADTDDAIRRYDFPSGHFAGIFAKGHFDDPQDLLFLPDGSLLVSGYASGNVVHFSDTGAYIGEIAPSGAEGLGGAAGIAVLWCPSDINRDGYVTGDDYDLYVGAFEAGDSEADQNGDGFTTGDDFDAFVSDFESGC